MYAQLGSSASPRPLLLPGARQPLWAWPGTHSSWPCVSSAGQPRRVLLWPWSGTELNPEGPQMFAPPPPPRSCSHCIPFLGTCMFFFTNVKALCLSKSLGKTSSRRSTPSTEAAGPDRPLAPPDPGEVLGHLD